MIGNREPAGAGSAAGEDIASPGFETPSAGRPTKIPPDILPYLVPMFAYVALGGLDGRYPPRPFLSSQRVAFDPTRLAPGPRFGFLVVRMLGLVVLVPVIEELFWRSFLIRWLIDPDDFPRVPIGRVTPLAAGVTSVLFALAHPEWLPALLTGLLWAWLLWQTKSLSACLISHAVANLAL